MDFLQLLFVEQLERLPRPLQALRQILAALLERIRLQGYGVIALFAGRQGIETRQQGRLRKQE
jgi:hypothetical protein